MPNDLGFTWSFATGKDVWVATGGAGHYDTYTKEWEIFTEKMLPCMNHGHMVFPQETVRYLSLHGRRSDRIH